MKKILYLMHIDWDWIKQRPHYIAEHLERESDCKIQVVYKKLYRKKLLTSNVYNLALKPQKMLRLPYESKFRFIARINEYIEALYIVPLIKQNDIIYVTHPSFYPLIKHVKHKRVIYDCMDDILGFSLSDNNKRKMEKYEYELIKCSNLVLFSAKHLQEVVQKRVDFDFKSIVVNNAINFFNYRIEEPIGLNSLFENKQKKIITYIGTISDWFDYELLLDVVTKDSSIIFYLFGPVEAKFPANDNIKFFGAQKHENIFYLMSQSDALIMPFKVTELIKSVNPVKLYEYIYSGKPVICVRYGETEKFEEYVYLYNQENRDTFYNILNSLKSNNYSAKKTIEEAVTFASSNTWSNRAQQILPHLFA